MGIVPSPNLSFFKDLHKSDFYLNPFRAFFAFKKAIFVALKVQHISTMLNETQLSVSLFD